MIAAAALLHALPMAFAMGWEIPWALILGFALSAVVQAVVSHAEMSRPILDIYRRYYGLRMAALLFIIFTLAMALAALVVELAFAAVGLVPREHQARVVEAAITWNYTTWLNIVFLCLAAALVWRAARTGGFAMLRGMNTMPADAPANHAHHHHRQ